MSSTPISSKPTVAPTPTFRPTRDVVQELNTGLVKLPQLGPEAATAHRQYYATVGNDILNLRNLDGPPPLPGFPAPPSTPPESRADLEKLLQSNPDTWKAYQKLTEEQKLQFLNLAKGSWRQAGGFPPRPPGLNDNLTALLQQGKLSSKDSQGQTLLSNLTALQQLQLPEGVDASKFLGDTLQSLGCNPLGMGLQDASSKLAQQKPAEYVRLLLGLAGEGAVKTAGGDSLKTGDWSSNPFMAHPSQLVRGALQGVGPDQGKPEVRRQQILDSLQKNEEAWKAYQKLTPQQQKQFLELADDQNYRRSFAQEKTVGLQPSPSVSPALLILLTSGKLGAKDSQGTTLLENLSQLKNQKFGEGVDGERIYQEVLSDLSSPSPTQEGAPQTPSAALKEKSPSEYVRLLRGLTGEKGEVKLATGEVVKRPELQPPAGGLMMGLGAIFGGSQSRRMIDQALGPVAEQRAGDSKLNEQRQQLFLEQLKQDAKAWEAYQKLSPEQQQKFMQLALRQRSRDAAALTEIAGQKPAIDQNLLAILKSGNLTRTDSKDGILLDNLVNLMNQDFPEGLDGAAVLEEVLAQVANPERIRQGPKNTCTMTCVEYLSAKQDPAEYVRLMAGLTSEKGEVELRNGETLRRDDNVVQDDSSGRTSASRIFQASMMEYANGPQDYDNQTDRNYMVVSMPDGSQQRVPQYAGLMYEHWIRGANAVLPYESVPVRYLKPEGRGQAEQIIGALVQSGRPVLVGMGWGQNSSHLLVVEGVDENYVYLRNPWGDGDRGSPGSPFEPAREVAPGRENSPSGGQIRMTKEEFFKFLNTYSAPAPAQ